jgi:hypothetical protein
MMHFVEWPQADADIGIGPLFWIREGDGVTRVCG